MRAQKFGGRFQIKSPVSNIELELPIRHPSKDVQQKVTDLSLELREMSEVETYIWVSSACR